VPKRHQRNLHALKHPLRNTARPSTLFRPPSPRVTQHEAQCQMAALVLLVCCSIHACSMSLAACLKLSSKASIHIHACGIESDCLVPVLLQSLLLKIYSIIQPKLITGAAADHCNPFPNLRCLVVCMAAAAAKGWDPCHPLGRTLKLAWNFVFFCLTRRGGAMARW